MTMLAGFSWHDLYDASALERVDATFLAWLLKEDAALHQAILEARSRHTPLSSEQLIILAPLFETYLGSFFDIEADIALLKAEADPAAVMAAAKRLFVQRQVAKHLEDLPDIEYMKAQASTYFPFPCTDRFFAKQVVRWLKDKNYYDKELEAARFYAAWALTSDEGADAHPDSVVFALQKKKDHAALVETIPYEDGGITTRGLEAEHLSHRDGFGLTDSGTSRKKALDQTHYCIICHPQGKDACSKGMKDAEGFKENPLSVSLQGCPLEEKISEMHLLRREGHTLGALAVAMIDNPLLAATGHRICNDCMQSCIYQKQDPVDIPHVETQMLMDILRLPWGFEIYSLLSRWNPLKHDRPFPKPFTGKHVLVAGLGPAGFTTAHYLLNEGHHVVGIDGLKVEPLPASLSGVGVDGKPIPFEPIADIDDIWEKLDERVMAGFGGVAEYGITVRWDKNFLKVIRLLLERRSGFHMFGGVRLGGTLTVKKARELGFDHVAVAVGAGKPNILDIPSGMARGVRAASDFLMALQLTGAAKQSSIANLQLRMPICVIGGGLTAIDTATETLAYYPVQVEKFLRRYEILVKEHGEDFVRASWTEEESEIAEEFITHAHAIRKERQDAAKEGRLPDLFSLLSSWGGVKLIYRRTMQESPSYRLNHEEVHFAMEEGVRWVEEATPVEVVCDRFSHASALKVKIGDSTYEIPAKSILMATGTKPNTMLAREDHVHLAMAGKYFQALDEHGKPVNVEASPKTQNPHIFGYVDPKDHFSMSFLGDTHPSFAGNVVKAMASGKRSFKKIDAMLAKRKKNDSNILSNIHDLLQARVHKVSRLTPTIVEVVIRAPLAAEGFEPGQFYRLQNYEMTAAHLGGEMPTTLAMEGVALTGAWVDKEKGLLSTIVLEMGGSADLCAYLKEGEPVILMGPTGTPTEIPRGKNVLLAGGGLGNAVLFSIGKALRAAGSHVLYAAGYKKEIDRYKLDDIYAASDTVLWCCDEVALPTDRPQDKSFKGNIVEGLLAYAKGDLGEQEIPLGDIDHMIVIGSDRMMQAVSAAREGVLASYLKPGHSAVASINSPMQCMMKEICAQCLQRHVDPSTGQVHYVYSCRNQDQPMAYVDFGHLAERLKQNTLQEKLTAIWIKRCLETLKGGLDEKNGRLQVQPAAGCKTV